MNGLRKVGSLLEALRRRSPAGLRVLLQREANAGNRLAGLRDGDDGFGTCGNPEAARRFQLAVADLELNFLLSLPANR